MENPIEMEWGYPDSWMVYFMESRSINGWFGGTSIVGTPYISWESKLRLQDPFPRYVPQWLQKFLRINLSENLAVNSKYWSDRSCNILIESQYIMIPWYYPSCDRMRPFSFVVCPKPRESKEWRLIIPSFGSLFLLCVEDRWDHQPSRLSFEATLWLFNVANYWKWPFYSWFSHWTWWWTNSYVSVPEGTASHKTKKWAYYCFSCIFKYVNQIYPQGGAPLVTSWLNPQATTESPLWGTLQHRQEKRSRIKTSCFPPRICFGARGKRVNGVVKWPWNCSGRFHFDIHSFWCFLRILLKHKHSLGTTLT